MAKYEVIYGRRGAKFEQLQDAIIFAEDKALAGPSSHSQAVTVWDDAGYVIAVVTNDTNGLTVHRLATWPEHEPCASV